MHHPEQLIRLRSSACTHTGRVRENNEDSIHIWAQNDHIVVATVADGMGGAVAGEEASRIVVEAINDGLVSIDENYPNAYEDLEDDDVISRLKSAIRSGNSNIINYAIKHPELKGMGTTVTMAFMRGTQAIIGHVGDSRAYLVDGADGHVMQITADHSFVQALVAAGHITEEQAEDHPMRNVLYRALGQTHDIEVDIYYERMRPYDRLVLCSDGLTLHVKPHEIGQITVDYDDPEKATQQLVDLANHRGGKDNVSVIVIKAEMVDEADLTEDDRNRTSNNFFNQDEFFDPDISSDETQPLPITNSFGPSESDITPPVTDRDGGIDRKPPSYNKRSHGDDDGDRGRSNMMGEGQDNSSRDQ